MQTITAPISPNEPRENRAAIIANLQDALLFLIDKELIRFEGAELPIRIVELRQDRQRSEFGAGTRNVLMAFRRQFQLGEGEIVDEATAKELNRLLRQAGAFAEPQGEWVVRGRVVDVNGPINDIQVSVFDRDLFFGRDQANSGDRLGAGLTKNMPPRNEDGCFEFTYTTAAFAAADIPGKDLTIPDLIFVLEQQRERLANFQIFRLPDGQVLTEETLVAADDLIMGIQARKVEEVRIVITNRERKLGLSEYEQLWQGIEPLLPGRVPADADDAQREAMVCSAAEGFDQEQHKDISFIVRETGLSFELLMVFAASCKLTALSFRQDVPPVVLYGLARGGRMTDLHSLATASASELKRGLFQAMADNRIPTLSDDVIAGSIETILRLAPPALTGETPFAGQPAFGERISAALPDPDEQSTLLRTFAENNDDPKKFWQRLRELPEFAEEGKVERVQFALQLDALTSSHVPLMRSLQSEHGVKTTRELLDFDDAKLRELLLRPEIGVPANVPGEGPQEKSDNYIESVIGALHLALPTESVAKSLREADAIHVGDEATQAALNTFFASATSEARRSAGTHFDIRETNIDDYVAGHGAETLADVAAEVRDQAVAQLKRAQRLFQVSTTPEAFQVLVRSGLDSARDIASIPQQTFVAQYTGAGAEPVLMGAEPVLMRKAAAFNELDESQALMIHSRATTISTSATHLYVALNSALNELQPNAIKILDPDAQRGVGEIIGKHLPNWQGLFGAPELCECGHCRSVYSPAAYLVDVLHFLEKSGRNADGFTPLDYLIGKTAAAPGGKSVMGRRPDIAQLKLTCENSNTALPYVDLINEVLESLAIAYASATEKQGSISVDYDAIAAHDTGDATTAELRANPQYTNLKAYHTPDNPNARAQLDRVSYPVTLPYDHAREAARVYLKHLGAELSELLERFGEPKNRVWLAAEILGLAPGQYEILTGQRLDGTVAELNQQVDELYGLTPELLPRLKTGDVGELVAALKRKLNTNGAALVLAAAPSIETFDAATETAVRDLQVAQGLDDDGIVKIGEWRALAALAPAVADRVLPNARQFLSRTGVTYEELVDLCETRFINPEQDVFEILLRLRVPANELIAFVAADFQDPGADLIKALEAAGVKPEDFAAWAGERLSSEGFERLKATVVLDAPADDPCNLDRTRLRRWDAAEPDLDAATWRRLNQLIRLWRKLGWSLRDLDRALGALETKEITPEVIVQLSVIKTVQRKLDLSIPEVVALWSTLETNKADSLYHKLFLSRAALRHDPSFAPDWKGEVLLGATIKEHLPALLGGLRLTSDDLAAVLTDLDGPLTLEQLSKVTRYAVLSRALGMRVRDLARLGELSGIDPFVKPEADWPLLQLIALSEQLDTTGLSLVQFDYLVGDASASVLAPRKEDVKVLLADLEAGLNQIETEFASTEDTTGELARARLSMLHEDITVVNAFGQLLDGSAVYIVSLDALPNGLVWPSSLAKRLTFDKTAAVLSCRGALTKAEANQLSNDAAANASYRQAIAGIMEKQRAALDKALNLSIPVKLVIPDTLTELIDKSSFNAKGELDGPMIAQKFKAVLALISPVLRDDQQRRFILQKLAESLGLDPDLLARLIDKSADGKILLHQQGENSKPLIDDLLKPANLPNATEAYLRLHRAVSVVNAFGLMQDELIPLTGTLIDFNQPTSAAVQQLTQYAVLKRTLPKTKESIAIVFTAPNEAAIDDAIINDLSKATGWATASLAQLIGPAGFDWKTTDLKVVANLARLRDCIRLLKRLGILPERAFAWARQPIDLDVAEDIKRVTKAKYEDAAWLVVAKPLSDRLRESQKAALIAYLLPRLNIENSDKLYEHLLIDVEMSACMMTSRIKQAMSSVQLFIQRCLMNLEQPNVAPSAIDSKQWEWMGRYRIWEANRKVFLYPENWIEPELRDDKTPFFKEFESELLQSDVTDANVEQALQNYLEKLDAVAKLQMCGMFVQSDFEAQEKKKEVVHVFGRTPNQPQAYYYRQYVVTTNDVSYWTPWEKVPVEVRGDQIAPVVWNRRLYLFWPLVATKANDTQPIPKTPENPETYQDVQIAWSEYRHGKWSPKYVTPPEQAMKITTRPSRLQAHIEGDELVVVYGEIFGYAEPKGGLAVCYPPGYGLLACGGGTTSATVTGQVGHEAAGQFVFESCHGELTLKNDPWKRYDKVGFIVKPTVVHPLGLDDGAPQATLGVTHDGVRLIEQQLRHSSHDYFIFEDSQRTYFVRLEATGGSQLDKLSQTDLLHPDSTRYSATLAEPYSASTELKHSYFTQVATTTASSNSWTSAVSRLGALSLQPQSLTLSAASSPASVGVARITKDTLALTHDFVAYSRGPRATLTYETLFHPFVSEFMKRLQRDGIPGVLNLDCQNMALRHPFESHYQPNSAHVAKPYPPDRVDFGQTPDSATVRATAYSTYNWELFFHIPMLVATRLNQNQRCEEAMAWLKYVFDTTDGKGDYWKVQPFRTTPRQHIETLLNEINANNSAATKQLAEWRDHPFQPHLIARMRLPAYQKFVVMKAIEIGLACGDYYFRQDTIESINIATQYYVWCANLLGPYPETIPARGEGQAKTFADLRKDLDPFSNAMKDFENKFPFYSSTSLAPTQQAAGLLGIGRSFYFCIPQNEKLLSFWDSVRDRLFKIRHCMNIEGVVRELPLFEPPIDPALLVQAAARGISLGSVINDLSAPTPPYRFSYMLQKSLDVCNDLRSLGAALLAALEKRDNEKLVLIRQQHERTILGLVKRVREQQIEEAQAALEVLNRTRAQAIGRYLHFQDLLGSEDLTAPPVGTEIPAVSARKKVVSQGGAHLIEEEKEELDASHSARDWQVRASMTETLASISSYIPTLTLNASPFGCGIDTMVFGGQTVAPALMAISHYQKSLGAQDSYDAAHASKMAGYLRREQDWSLQSNTAAREIMQIDKQIIAAQIRLQITKYELENHEQQIQNAETIEEFLNSKYTQEELYRWMVGKVSEVYFQCYQLAYDLAKKAERTFRFERGLETSGFIKSDSWDSLRKGLMAGEQLALQLRQMDRAYHDQNKREYEITRHISLTQLDPMALISLKQTGVCEFDLPEALFDLDFPGHYFRRIKSVSLSVPCVVGPFTSVSGSLTLLNNRIRTNNLPADPYAEKLEEDDKRFLRDYLRVQSVATSSGQNDSGLFELSFRDERYLPFEGGGAISRWRFELPRFESATEFRQFDYGSISDVVLHLKFTSREGGQQLKDGAVKALKKIVKEENQKWQARVFSLRHEFPSEWHRFLTFAQPGGQTFPISKERFPFLFQDKKITVYLVDLFAALKTEVEDLKDKLTLTAPSADIPAVVAMGGGENIGALEHLTGRSNVVVKSEPANPAESASIEWKLKGKDSATTGAFEDILLVCHYTVRE